MVKSWYDKLYQVKFISCQHPTMDEHEDANVIFYNQVCHLLSINMAEDKTLTNFTGKVLHICMRHLCMCETKPLFKVLASTMIVQRIGNYCMVRMNKMTQNIVNM